MPGIDNRVVSLLFDNKQFMSAVSQTLKSLTNLDVQIKKASNSNGPTRALNDVSNAMSKLPISKIAQSVDMLTNRFSAFGIASMAVIARVTNAAIDMGKKLVSAVSTPIVQGGISRAMNLENARFMLQSLYHDESLVQNIMDSALNSVDGTAYSYDVAAKAASMFASSGIKAGEQMDKVLAALAGTTATVNADYGSMSEVFTNIAGNGRLMGEQLLQFSARGINAAADLAEAYGKSEAEIRKAISDGKISAEDFFDVMYKKYGENAKMANETVTGVSANIRSALAKIGELFVTPFIGQNGPLVQFLNTVREKINSVKEVVKPFATSVTTTLIGYLDKINTFIGGIRFDKFFQGLFEMGAAVSHILEPVKRAFERVFPLPTILSSRVRYGIDDVNSLIFRFEEWARTLTLSESNTKLLESVSAALFSIFKLGGHTISKAADTFGKLWDKLEPLRNLVKDIVSGVSDLITSFVDSGRAADIVDTVFDTIYGAASFVLDILYGIVDGVKAFAEPFSNSFSRIRQFVLDAWEALKQFFKPITDYGDGAIGFADKFRDAMRKAGKLAEPLAKVMDFLLDVVERVWGVLKQIGQKVADVLKSIGSEFKAMMGTGNAFEKIFNLWNAAGFGGVILSVLELIKNASGTIEGVQKFFDSIGGALTSLKDAIKGFQKGIDANTFKTLAVSLLILAGALLVLSTLDIQEVAVALAGLSGAIGEFLLFIAALSKILKGSNSIGAIRSLSTALIPLGQALILFALAIRIVGGMPWQDVIKGVGAMAGVMGALAVTVTILSKSLTKKRIADNIRKVAKALIPLGTSLILMSLAIRILGSMRWQDLVKGLAGFAAIMGGMTLAVSSLAKSVSGNDVAKNVRRVAKTVMPLAVALLLLSAAIRVIGSMRWQDVAKGLGSIAVMMGGFVLAIDILAKSVGNANTSKSVARVAKSLLPVAAAMLLLTASIRIIGSMRWQDIVQGLGSLVIGLGAMLTALVAMEKLKVSDAPKNAAAIALLASAILVLSVSLRLLSSVNPLNLAVSVAAMAASLLIMVTALKLCEGMGSGALALMGVGVALAFVTPSLMAFALLPFPKLVQGLVGLASALGIMSVALTVLSTLNAGPGLLMIAGAFALLGVAVAAVGVGLVAAGIGLTTIGMALQTFGTAIINVIQQLIGLIPYILQQIGIGIVSFAQAIMQGAPVLVGAIVAVISELLTGLTTLIPQLVTLIMTTIDSLLQALVEYVPRFVDAGMKIIIALLDGLSANMYEITTKAIEVLTAFINGVADKIGDVIDAGMHLIEEFIRGLADGVRNHGESIVAAVGDLIMAIVEGIPKFLSDLIAGGKDILMGLLEGLWNGICDFVSNIASFFQPFVDGILDFFGIASPSKLMMGIGEDTGQGFIEGMDNKQGEIVSSGQELGSSFVSGVDEGMPDMRQYGVDRGTEFNEGVESQYPFMRSSGEGTGRSYAEGLSSQQQPIMIAGKAVGDSAVQGVRSSNDWGTEGYTAGNAYSDGIGRAQLNASAAGTGLAGSAASGAGTGSDDMANKASEAGQRFANEVSAHSEAAYTAGSGLATQMNEGIKSAPSDAFQSGQLFGADFVNGISSQQDQARQAGTDFVGAATSGFQTSGTNSGTMLADTFISQINSKQGGATSAGSSLASAVKTGLSSISNSIGAVGRNAATQYNSAVRSKTGDATTNGKSLASAVLNGMKSVASQFTSAGRTAGGNFINGINGSKSSAYSTGSGFANEVRKGLVSVSMWQTGRNVIQGFIDGMGSKMSDVRSKAAEIARAAKSAANAELGVKSPSRVFIETGHYVGEGLAIGIEQMIPAVRSSASGLGDTLIMSVRDAIDAISYEEIDSTPVITPVIDLSSVRSGARQLGSILSGSDGITIDPRRTRGMAQGISATRNDIRREEAEKMGDRASTVVNNNTYEFNQTNNSPKSLSNLEIYRDTKNLLAITKGFQR